VALGELCFPLLAALLLPDGPRRDRKAVAMAKLGVRRPLRPVALGPPIQSKAENTKLYAAMLAAQKTLYEKLFAGNS